MKKKILKSLGVLSFICLLTVNVSVFAKPAELQQASSSGGVQECCCAGSFFLGRSCKANGKGAGCAVNGTSKCWELNKNCTR